MNQHGEPDEVDKVGPRDDTCYARSANKKERILRSTEHEPKVCLWEKKIVKKKTWE